MKMLNDSAMRIRVRRHMDRTGETLTGLSGRAGMPQSWLSDFLNEAKDTGMTPKQAHRLAPALGMTYEEFIGPLPEDAEAVSGFAISGEEVTLIKYVRRMNLAPDHAIALIGSAMLGGPSNGTPTARQPSPAVGTTTSPDLEGPKVAKPAPKKGRSNRR
jgi:hypothetical protein